jgi:PAS domain S-box-containing protein
VLKIPRRYGLMLNPSLRTVLAVVFGGVTVAVVIAVGLAAERIGTREVERYTGASLAELASRAADRLDRNLFDRLRDLELLARSEYVDGPAGTVERRNAVATLQAIHPEYAWIGFTDRDGTVAASTRGLLEGIDVSHRDWFGAALTGPFVGDVHEANLLADLLPNGSDEPLRFVDVAAPFRDEAGRVIGVLGAHLHWTWARDVLGALIGEAGAEILILDHAGVVLFGPKDLSGQTLRLTGTRPGDRESNVETWPDGRDYIAGFNHSDGHESFNGLGWTVVAREDAATALAPAHRLQQQIIFWGLALAAFVGLLTYGLAHRIAAPVRKLTAGADAIRNNRETVLPQVKGYAEVASLSASLVALLDERRRSEEELSRTRAFLDLVIENIPDVLFVKDAHEYRYVLANRACEELLGRDRSDLIGKNDYDLFPKEQADQFVAADREVLSSGALQIIEEPLETRQHGRRTVRTKKMPVLGERGEPLYLLGISEDITEWQTIEEQLRQSQKMEAIGNLTGGLSHDFNNLLGVVIGNADLLTDHIKDNPQATALLDDVLEAALRGAELNRRLLAFARRQPLQPKKLDVNELVAGIIKLLSRTLGENVEITIECAGNLWPVVVDPAQLEASIVNIATNARDAMPNGGQLTIATRNGHLDEDYAAEHPEVAPGDYVVIEITDTGTGMPPEVASSAFEPFFTTKEVGKGTGLGLSMVFGFVKQSGGHAKIYSEEGSGTTIRFYLPRSAQEDQVELLDLHGPIPLATGSETVLVVEDNEKLRQLLLKQLQDLGYAVLEAEHAGAALEILRGSESIDLLLTDIVMPGMNGHELALEAVRMHPGLRVLFTSGFPESALGESGRISEGDLLLSKPYRKQELAHKVREALAA